MARHTSSLSFFTEEFPDGIRDVEPTWTSYCFDTDSKRTLAEHQRCAYFGGMVEDRDGGPTAFRCALRKS